MCMQEVKSGICVPAYARAYPPTDALSLHHYVILSCEIIWLLLGPFYLLVAQEILTVCPTRPQTLR